MRRMLNKIFAVLLAVLVAIPSIPATQASAATPCGENRICYGGNGGSSGSNTRNRDRGWDRNRNYDRNWDRNRDRGWDRVRDRNWDRPRNPNWDRGWDRPRNRNWDRGRDWQPAPRYYYKQRRYGSSNTGAFLGGLAAGVIIKEAIDAIQSSGNNTPTGRVGNGCNWGPEKRDGRFGVCNGQNVFQAADGTIYAVNR